MMNSERKTMEMKKEVQGGKAVKEVFLLPALQADYIQYIELIV